MCHKVIKTDRALFMNFPRVRGNPMPLHRIQPPSASATLASLLPIPFMRPKHTMLLHQLLMLQLLPTITPSRLDEISPLLLIEDIGPHKKVEALEYFEDHVRIYPAAVMQPAQVHVQLRDAQLALCLFCFGDLG
jgi:hypothetical protein